MIVKFLFAYACLGISIVYSAEENNSKKLDENKKDGPKDKRQIDYHQTSINPHQHHQHQQHQQLIATSAEPSTRIDTIYGSHPNQFVIKAIGQPLQDIQQRQLQQLPEQTAEVSQQYAIIQEIEGPEKPSKTSRKYSIGKSALQYAPQRQPQYIQQYHQEVFPQQIQHQQHNHQQQQQQQQQQLPPQQYQLINPQDELLKFFQDEIAFRALTLNNNQKQRQQNTKTNPSASNNNNQKQQGGLGNFREPQIQHANPEIVQYIQENIPQPQAYYQPIAIDYHKSIPNHPLAVSSLEKELEKLVASNKPYHQSLVQPLNQPIPTAQPTPYKAPKIQQQIAATYSTAAPVTVPAPQEKFFSFFPDFAHLSAFKPTANLYIDEQLQPTKVYPTENAIREQKPRKVSSASNVQYLTEKQKYKLNQASSQQKQSHLYNTQQKEQQLNYAPNPTQDNRNSAVKIIQPPTFNYEKSQANSSPIISYYKAESTERPEQQQQQQQQKQQQQQQKLSPAHPSTSTIFVSQGTGIHTASNLEPQAVQPTKAPYGNNNEKLPQLPPLDGKPLTQEEFQALVDAGYPVQAVPVPVPVPYDQFIRHQQSLQPQSQALHHEDRHHQRNERRQIRPIQKQQVTYLHPIRIQHQHQLQQRSSA